jgi:uncharacterized protein YbaR (Trm112 family)
MDRDLLRRLRCPNCKQSFDSSVVQSGAETIQFATLQCSCSAYPVVAGIPVLRSDSLTQLARKQLELGRTEVTTTLLLNESRWPLPARTLLGKLAGTVN